MSSGRVIGAVAFTCDPSDVKFILMTKREGCQLAYLYQQFKVPSASAFKCKRTGDAVGKAKNSCIPDMFRTHHHLQTTKHTAGLAQKDVIFEFPFWACDHAEATFLEEPELDFREFDHL